MSSPALQRELQFSDEDVVAQIPLIKLVVRQVLVGRPHDVIDDAQSEAMLQCLEYARSTTFRDNAGFRSAMGVIARRTAFGVLRADYSKPRPEPLSFDHTRVRCSTESALIARQLLELGLNVLQPHHREFVIRGLIHGESDAEIAKAMQFKESYVRLYKSRAKIQLRKKMQREANKNPKCMVCGLPKTGGPILGLMPDYCNCHLVKCDHLQVQRLGPEKNGRWLCVCKDCKEELWVGQGSRF